MMINMRTTIHKLKLNLGCDKFLSSIYWDQRSIVDDVTCFLDANYLSFNMVSEKDPKTGEKFNKLTVDGEPVAYGSYILSNGCVLTPKQFSKLFEIDRNI